MMKKRSIRVAGHATSVSLEEPFWTELRRIAADRGQKLDALIAEIDRAQPRNLSSAIRIFVLEDLKRDRARRT